MRKAIDFRRLFGLLWEIKVLLGESVQSLLSVGSLSVVHKADNSELANALITLAHCFVY